MRFLPLLLAAMLVSADDVPPVSVLIGDVLEVENTNGAGALTVRARDNRVHRCTFDGNTWFDRAGAKTTAETAKAQDRIEAVADRGASTLCHLRTVHMFEPVRPKPAITYQLGKRTPLIDLLAPRGNITFSAVVLRRTPESLFVRTRLDGNKTLVLRNDTRYLRAGLPVEAVNLEVNTRVFIRAGRNFENELEAFQVVWGDILNVR